MESAVDEAAENERSRGGHGDKAGIGEMEGEGDESRVVAGEVGALWSAAAIGFGAMFVGAERSLNARKMFIGAL